MKQKLRNYLLKHLLNPVLPEDVITTIKGSIYLNGKILTTNELKQLQAEIKALEGFRIWSILTNSLRHVAQDKIFNKSVVFDDVTAGKMMLFSLDTQESIVRVIKNKS